MIDEAHARLAPSRWVTRFASLIEPGARTLDVAAGEGRHARWLAARGIDVVAVDRDAEAMRNLGHVPRVEARIADLENGPWPFGAARFDAVVVTNYLHRPLFPLLLAALADDGVFIYETFAAGNERYGRPSNPLFLLERNELLDRVRDALVVIAFEDGMVHGERESVVQRIAAVGRTRAVPALLPPR